MSIFKRKVGITIILSLYYSLETIDYHYHLKMSQKMAENKETATPVVQSHNLADELRPRLPTTSLDPYSFDDDLIPYSATCCHVGRSTI